MAAKFLVTVPPGAPVPGVGFVKPGDVFVAPEGYVPSRTFRPANEEGKKELEKVFAAEKERLENAKKGEQQSVFGAQLAQLEAERKERLELYNAPADEVVVEHALTLGELDKLGRSADRPHPGAQHGPQPDTQAAALRGQPEAAALHEQPSKQTAQPSKDKGGRASDK